MINELEIYNFKCFQSLSIQPRNLNILMGLNGMGKSTVLQIFLLLRQSWMENKLEGLKLNSKYVKLGNGTDVLYERSEDEKIRIRIMEDDIQMDMSFEYDASSDLLNKEKAIVSTESFQKSVLFSNRFLYLSAFRSTW